MSGDVQPRKRKDKKKKKDELSVEEPRGTAAALGEGDVFMHSHHDHGTGGHWCAKVIFFSLLAVLITLIGLIILENRGLSELEANAVESRYSGVLEGWIEESADDDHHDVHTLELKHHDEDEHDDGDSGHDDHDDEDIDEDHSQEELDNEDQENDDQDLEDDIDQNEDEDDQNDDDVDQNDDDDDQNEDDDDDQSQEEFDNEDQGNDDQDLEYDNDQNVDNDDQNKDDQNEDGDDDQNEDGDDDDQNEDNDDEKDENSIENYNFDEGNQNDEVNESPENDDQNEEDDDDHDDDEDDHDEEENVELEKLEEEPDDQEPISMELPALPEADDDDDDNDDDKKSDLEEGSDDGEQSDDDDFLEQDELDNEPPVERITAPSGKPLKEVDEEESNEQPVDTLADEEEYEKQQEELRRQEEEASHVWLKLGVGGALLAATHAVLRRAGAATTERDDGADEDEVREETPTPDRRMTLIPERAAPAVKQLAKEPPQKKIQDEVLKQIPSITKSAPTPKQVSLDDEPAEQPDEEDVDAPTDDKELYSDEEIEETFVAKKDTPKPSQPVEEDVPEADEDDDVEIIEEEDLEEQIEEELEDVDDAELLSRLEAKYGRLPEPERPGQKFKDGGNSVDEDRWPGEPADAYWRQQLDSAEQELGQGSWSTAAELASAKELDSSARARWIVARAYDEMAEARRDNTLLSRSITAYLRLLKMNDNLSDERLLQITNRTVNRIQFRGNYLSAEPVHRLLIRRFPDNPAHRNNLTISFLMANRVDLAAEVLKETLNIWPEDPVALAHYAFVLKTHFNKYEEAVKLFQKALESDDGPANEPRFYYHYGDSLLLLGRHAEALEVHKRGAKLGHFLSPEQRSLYNVNRLKSQPWWNVDKTPYSRLARALEKNWKEILKEGEAARALYAEEKEGLRESGEWSQLDLFVRGREIPDRCKRAPVTCSLIKAEAAAAGCRRGQIKFSSIEPGTHVRAHVGPTNCRLRMHLALSNTKDAFMRVGQETRQWQLGKVLMFDDSFEHEVWHNGTGTRLVLIVDVWHPDLTPTERRTLPAI